MELDSTDQWVRDSKAAIRDAETDYFRHSPWIYWRDFLFSTFLAYAFAAVFLQAEIGSLLQGLAFPLAVFWLYRAGSLIHEVAHLGEHEMKAFKVTWNIVAGVPMLAPSPFFSAHHRDHHSHRLYGTKQDPEYIVNLFRRGDVVSLIGYFALVFAFPVIVTARFIVAPLTFLHPRLREFVLVRCSSLMMNPHYVRRVNAADRRRITAIEMLCCLRATAIPAAVLLGLHDWTRIPLLYALGVSVLLMNQMRLLADHHFSSDGEVMSAADHICDSCNYTGSDFFTWLLFPFSIRYHALHHLFPSMPYHNLQAADQYLMDTLPHDSRYRDLQQSSWLSVARRTLFAPSN